MAGFDTATSAPYQKIGKSARGEEIMPVTQTPTGPGYEFEEEDSTVVTPPPAPNPDEAPEEKQEQTQGETAPGRSDEDWLRAKALDLAVSAKAPADEVIARATAYLAFLKGPAT
jgi:hypothetical protein